MSREMHPFLQRLAHAGAYEPPERPQHRRTDTAPPTPGDPQAARYAEAALREECEDVARTPEGTRNDRLNRAAFRIGQLVGAGYLDRWAADEALTGAGTRCGLPGDEVARTVNSGLDGGSASPREVIFRAPETTSDAYTLAPEEPASMGDAHATAANADVPVPALTDMASRILTRNQLKALPRPEPLIADTLDLGTVAVLAGYWGTCKSFLALDWAACIATEKDWQGRKVARRKALYVAAEGAHGLDSRLSAWERAWHRQIDNDDVHVLPDPVQLGQIGSVAELCDVVSSGGYQFVVIDTLAKCMVGLDENGAQDMGRVVHALYSIRKATAGGTVLAVHHTGKDKTTVRGSSVLEAGVDTVYTTEGDHRLIKLTRTKRKDGPTDDTHTLTLSRVDYTDSAVIEIARDAGLTGNQTALLAVFQSQFSETGATKADLRNAAEMPSASFFTAVNGLVKAGKLINEGTDKRPLYRKADP